MKKIALFCLGLLSTFALTAQQLFVSDASSGVNPDLVRKQWSSKWITSPDKSLRDYGVYHFRNSFTLAGKPSKFIVHLSADNRYRFFVNGVPVVSGPARGDLYNWYYETLDIAQYLKSGNNTLAALVWNMGALAPVAQISNQTAFVIQGNTDAEKMVNSGPNWKVITSKAYEPCSMDNGPRLRAYMVIGPGDKVDASKHLWGWEQPGYDDRSWKSAVNVATPSPSGTGSDNQWTLTPRNIPLMEEKLQRINSVRRAQGATVTAEFLSGKKSLTIAPNKKVTILLDQDFNTVAYPELIVSGGKGSSVTLTYAEALFDSKRVKGNRNEIDGKEIIGNYDIFLPDGGKNRLFRPLWLRTYRYLQLDITTGAEPLVVNDLYGKYSTYPFEEKATFTSNDPSMKNLWDVSWRTARLCAGETYFDCPYYEQLQYEGDTRIQALISLYVTGDDRLMRKAILDFNNSRVPEGLTQGRYPSNRLQLIPPYSLIWVSMIYDYWMHRKDDAFIKQFLVPMAGVLNWYEQKIDKEKKILGPMNWWNFVDYTVAFKEGVPEGATDGNSSIITLQYIYALKHAAELFNTFGKPNDAAHYTQLANSLNTNTYNHCFDKTRGLMANTPEKNSFSQHASLLGVLTGAIPEQDEKEVMSKVLSDSKLGPVTFYFRFYLNQALKKAGMGDLYYRQSSLTDSRQAKHPTLYPACAQS
ncbi:MAG: alpha-L-rhamnosidase [Sphingobacteriales bacterium]|nr:MAG: alpha-L-rhamnosidase [Sphingobacteriales bacterium]